MNRSNNSSKENIIFPNYKKSIVNLASTILQTYNVKPFHPVLTNIDVEKLKAKQNIVLIILDGLGYNLLLQCAQDSAKFMLSHLEDKLTSVFPSTTSAAITSLLTGRTPWEHGAIGWTLYFKEFAKNIDFLPNWDSITGSKQDAKKYNLSDYLGAENIFELINFKSPDTALYAITMKKISKSLYSIKDSGSTSIIPYKKTKHLFRNIKKTILKNKNRKKFIYAYSSSPDKLEHLFGTDSKKVKKYISNVDRLLEKFAEQLKGTNTTIFVTADHGLLDIQQYHYVNEDKELFDCLYMPTFPEPRFISFFVKPHKMDKFKEVIKKYKDDYIFLTRQEFIAKGYLGNGIMHPKIDDFLGDYLAIAISTAAMKSIYMQNGKWKKEFLAHHAGLTEDEMLIPLIKIDL